MKVVANKPIWLDTLRYISTFSDPTLSTKTVFCNSDLYCISKICRKHQLRILSDVLVDAEFTVALKSELGELSALHWSPNEMREEFFAPFCSHIAT